MTINEMYIECFNNVLPGAEFARKEIIGLSQCDDE